MIVVLTPDPIGFMIGLALVVAAAGPFAGFVAAVAWAVEHALLPVRS